MARIISAFCFIFLAALPSNADVIGKITGTLDNQTWEWSVIRVDGAGATGTFSEIIPGYVSVTIQGHPGTTFAIKDSLAVTFILQGDAVSEPSILYIPEGGLSEYYEAEGGAVTLTLTEKRVEALEMYVEGTAVARLVHTKRDGLEFSQNPEDVIDLTVDFKSMLVSE